MTLLKAALIAIAGASPTTPADVPTIDDVQRISIAAPFPRGLAVVDGDLYVLCRGRVREIGGVTAEVDDQAGTIYVMDPEVNEPAAGPVGDAVRGNGRVFARPTSPPFVPWDRTADPPESDRVTDRPYCVLRFHEPSRSFYICAFSGIDKAVTADDHIAFSKNLSDAILRYDLRTSSWHEVERHDIEAGGTYPHADPSLAPPPHGWLNGPDNCLPLGDSLYAVAKDNSRLVRYDVAALAESPHAPPPRGEIVCGPVVEIDGVGRRTALGQSALAYHDGWLYVGYRTTSVILRIRLDDAFAPVPPVRAQVVARFDPYDPVSGHSANITDMSFDDRGRLYVISARPARVHRFVPDPDRVYDARNGTTEPWCDLAALTKNPRMKSENVLYHDGWLYVTSGDGYSAEQVVPGTVYRVAVRD